MDPVTIISLAGNVITFIEFGGRVISRSLEIYHAGSDALEENLDAEALTTNFISVVNGLPVPAGQREEWTTHEQAFDDLRRQSVQSAQELRTMVRDLTITGEGGKRFWKTAAAVSKTMWSQPKMVDMQNKISRFTNQLNLELLSHISEDVKTGKTHIKGLLELQAEVAAMIDLQDRTNKSLQEKTERAVVEQADALQELIQLSEETVSKVSTSNHEATRAHDTELHRKTNEAMKGLSIEAKSDMAAQIQQHSKETIAAIAKTTNEAVARTSAAQDKTHIEVLLLKGQAKDLKSGIDKLQETIAEFAQLLGTNRSPRMEQDLKAATVAFLAQQIVYEEVMVSISNGEELEKSKVAAYPQPESRQTLPSPKLDRGAQKQISPEGSLAGPAITTGTREARLAQNTQPVSTAKVQRAAANPRFPTMAGNNMTILAREQYVHIGIRVAGSQRLIQLDITHINDDKMFFHKLFTVLSRFQFFYSPYRIYFAKFYLDDETHVRVLDDKDILPPPNRTDYVYSPCPAVVLPPVGPDTLLDYLRRPSGIRGGSHNILDKIPKAYRDGGPFAHEVWGLNVELSLGGF